MAIVVDIFALIGGVFVLFWIIYFIAALVIAARWK